MKEVMKAAKIPNEIFNEKKAEFLMKYSMKTPSINYERGNESGQDF